VKDFNRTLTMLPSLLHTDSYFKFVVLCKHGGAAEEGEERGKGAE